MDAQVLCLLSKKFCYPGDRVPQAPQDVPSTRAGGQGDVSSKQTPSKQLFKNN